MSDSPRKKAPAALRDFPRKAQFPPLLAAAAAPAVSLLMLAVRPEAAGTALLFPALCALLAEICLLVPGRSRLPAGLAGCALLLALGVRLLDAAAYPAAAVVPIGCAGLLLASLPMAAWPREREPSGKLFVAGALLHAAAQFMVNVARKNGAQEPWLASAPALLAYFWLFLLLAMLSLSRAALADASWGRQRAPFSTRAKNTLMTVGLWALTLLLSSWRPLVAALRRGGELIADAVRSLARALLSLLPAPSQGAPSGAGGGMPEFGAAAEASGPNWLAVLLERVLSVLALAVLAVGAALLLRQIALRLIALIRALLRRMEHFAAASSEDYVDEISDTRERGKDVSFSATRRVLGLSRTGDLSPRMRIRRRYARLRARLGWPDASTARETLPPAAAALYERARYSGHEISPEDAERFERESRARASK